MDVDESAWVEAFVTAVKTLGVGAHPDVLADTAMAIYMTHGDGDPVKVARWLVDQLGLPRLRVGMLWIPKYGDARTPGRRLPKEAERLAGRQHSRQDFPASA
jgi:hypothetical protein